MMNWIAIDDRLPPSGRRVIFFWMNDYNPPKARTSIGYYASKYTLDADHWEEEVEFADYVEEQDKYFCPEGWYEQGWELEYVSPVSGVTHWMELPETPETT